MDNYFVSSCKRVKDWICRQFGQKEKKTVHHKKFADGGEVIVWETGRAGEEAASYENLFLRKEIAGFRTNIRREQSCSIKSLTRDYLYKQLLSSGEYTFDHMLVIKDPYGEAPLTALALFILEEPACVRVTTKGNLKETDFVTELPKKKEHRVPILGMYAEKANDIVIEILDDEGNCVKSHTFTIRTKRLPKSLRNVITVKKWTDKPAYSNIMINGGVKIHTCVFDIEGKIRYYLSRKPRGYGIFPLSDGHFFYMEKYISVPSYSNPQTVESYDMDYFGRVFRTYLTEKGVHHTAEEKAGGNILTGSNSMLEHTEDCVIEIDRQTGEIVWQLNMAEIFDETYQNMMDWCHVNSAAYYEKDRTILISLRNVHAVICVDYDTKKLRWILSDPKFWEGTKMTPYLLQPEGDVKWCYQQHAAFEIALPDESNPQKKRIIVYDNHWAKRRKAKSFDKDPLSYVSFYDIDEEKKSVSLHKRFAGPKTRIRANGIYVPDKKRVYNMAGSYAEPVDGDGGGIFEYDYETGEVLSEFGVKPGFFRAYPFEPNVQELAEPMQVTGDYQVGQIKQPQEISSSKYCKLKSEKKHHIKSAAIEYEMQEDLLFVNNVDHEVEKVYFIGDKGGYQVDFDDTYQTMDVFRTMVYKVAMQLTNLPKDKYKIYLQVKGELQTTKRYIDISAVN